jgi:hypothetical protein
MFPQITKFFSQPIVQRTSILAFTSMIILSSAASCTLPGFNNASNQPTTILGVLKQDPNFVLPNGTNREGFGAVNAVKLLDGTYDTGALGQISGTKMIQFGKEDFYILSQNRGLFKSIKTREINGQKYEFDVLAWERKYIYPVDKEGTNEQIDANIAKNNTIIATSIAIEKSRPQIVLVSAKVGNIGKIFKSTDGGNSFKEMYSEVQNGIGVTTVVVDPRSDQRIYASLEGGTVIRSLDGGISWQKLRNFSDVVVQIGFVPEFDNQFYLLTKTKGLYVSGNDGDTWDEVNISRNPAPKVGVDAPKDIAVNQNILRPEKFGVFEKIIPVTAKKGQWLLISDRQIWYTEGLDKPFNKLLLPLQSEQFNIADAQPDPQKGLERILVSIENKLFETNNRGQSWTTNDKINLSSPVGNIGQIVIDSSNPSITYLMLIDPKNTRGNLLFGF